ncbi:MAG: antibiotic biosynthesis monooxygenase [Chloroflexota bacterium]
MVVSALTRQTRITERAVWEAALGTVAVKIREVLQGEPGFVSLEYAWGTDEPGRFLQLTTWESQEDCTNYVRGGGAALVATIEDAAVPTAAYPNGSWVRRTYEPTTV